MFSFLDAERYQDADFVTECRLVHVLIWLFQTRNRTKSIGHQSVSNVSTNIKTFQIF